jgi:enoyl-CoA hydratase/carnithine racemase
VAYEQIIYTKDHGVATITLNRPEMMNALSPTMMAEWVSAIESAKYDDDVRVLVVTGAGKGFCSGADLKAMATAPDAALIQKRDTMRRGVQRIPLALASFDKLYVASINGAATGGGFDMCSMADIRIASDRARFSLNHLRIAGLSADGGWYFLTRLLGIAKTIELAMKWDFFDAAEALRLGYVSQVVPHEELPDATRELASRFAAGPPIAMQFAKRLIYQSLDVSLEKHLEDVARAWLINEATEDFREGPRAFVEKRPPRFTGR